MCFRNVYFEPAAVWFPWHGEARVARLESSSVDVGIGSDQHKFLTIALATVMLAKPASPTPPPFVCQGRYPTLLDTSSFYNNTMIIPVHTSSALAKRRSTQWWPSRLEGEFSPTLRGLDVALMCLALAVPLKVVLVLVRVAARLTLEVVVSYDDLLVVTRGLLVDSLRFFEGKKTRNIKHEGDLGRPPELVL